VEKSTSRTGRAQARGPRVALQSARASPTFRKRRLPVEGGVISNDLVTNQENITENQAEHVGLTTQHEHDIEEAQSHHSDVVCDEDEIVVANGPQRGLRSNGSIIDPHTKDTLGTRGRMRDLTDANDSSSNVEEDSDHTGHKGNTPNHARPRAKRASAASSSIPETPKKRRKMSTHVTEQTTWSTVNDIIVLSNHRRYIS
jgi:hypothetical protein